MKNNLHLCCVLLLLPLLQIAGAQPLLTPEAAIAAALDHHHGILLAKNDLTAAALDVEYANGAFLPRVNATIGHVWNNNNQKQEFSDGEVRKRNGVRSGNISAAVNLNWTLFDGMKMFVTKDKVEEIRQFGELGIKNEVVNTVAEVTSLYFNIVRQRQQLKAIAEQMSVSEERVKVAERKLETGLGSKPELLQAKVDLNAQKARQLQQQTGISQLKEQLRQFAGLQLPEIFEVIDSIPFRADLRLEQLQEGIAATNPGLLLAEKNISIARLSLGERKAERLPTVSFNSAYNFSRLDNQTVVNPFQPLLNRSNGFNFGLVANVPILNNRLALRNIEQAELSIQKFQLVLDESRTQVETGLKNAFRSYQYEQQALALEEENIELAKENVAIALERFRQGVSVYLELREAQKSLEDAYDRLIAARYNTKLAETELMRLKGELVK